MKTIRVLIVDDIALARERVRRYLDDESDIEIVGEAASGEDALRLIARLSPDIVFLDMKLTAIAGLNVAQRMQDAHAAVIYLSAFEDKAVEAFEVNALDYLLKPFDRERFRQALNRARARLLERRVEPDGDLYPRRIAVRNGNRTDMVATSDIDFIDIAGHYLCLHQGKRVHLIRATLAEFEKRLDPSEFARVHRSAIVRVDRVSSLVARRNGDSDIVLADGGKLLLSRTYRDALLAKLNVSRF